MKIEEIKVPIDIYQKFSTFSEHWSPKILAELNGQYVKIAKVEGEFVWHKHPNEDELFYVIKGCLDIEFEDKTITLNENQMLVVPRGTMHRPIAKVETWILLFEPISTINTGETESELKQLTLEKL